MGKTALEMNLGTILLINFLVFFSFCLKGVVAVQEIHGLLNESVLLPAPSHKGTSYFITWVKLIDSKPKVIIVKPQKEGERYSERYKLFSNGSLTIDKLKQDDAGDYRVAGHSEKGTALFQETIVTLKVHEPLHQPQLILNCSQNMLICEVKSNREQRVTFTLFQSNQMKTLQEPTYANGSWRVMLKQKNLSGKFRCEVTRQQIDKQHAEIEINCLGLDFLTKYIIYFLLIGGGVLLFIILALIIYCIQKKRAKRRELEDQEREMEARLAENTLKFRQLPQPSVQAAPHHSCQQQRPPPTHSKQQVKVGAPRPRPRPPQQKPPRRMKEIL